MATGAGVGIGFDGVGSLTAAFLSSPLLTPLRPGTCLVLVTCEELFSESFGVSGCLLVPLVASPRLLSVLRERLCWVVLTVGGSVVVVLTVETLKGDLVWVATGFVDGVSFSGAGQFQFAALPKSIKRSPFVY